MTSSLPIERARQALLEAGDRPVLTAATGSGKSTQVPRWCLADGPTLVVEPRRVACRALASYVASLEGQTVGERVGYEVRDERVRGAKTELLFVTPGIALKMMVADPALEAWAWVWLDEFHERTLQVDLLLALLVASRERGLGVMSATVESERIARFVGGVSVHAEGRSFPVEVTYLEQGDALPRLDELVERVVGAAERCRSGPGDVLVFLPGRREIEACARSLASFSDFDVMSLHGGQSLSQQGRVFRSNRRRKLVLSTNVAETSLTIDGVRWVIDSGLVRQQRWHGQHSFLSTVAVAQDSAEQRRGRAGRTAPGQCLRLWSPHVQLAAVTPPEMSRVPLDEIALACLAVGPSPERLQWLDSPPAEALNRAMDLLSSYSALAPEGGLSPLGHDLSRLPVGPWAARLLVEGRRRGELPLIIDLVAALEAKVALAVAPADDLESSLARSDTVGIWYALRSSDDSLLTAWRRTRARLGRLLGCSADRPLEAASDSEREVRLAAVIIAADASMVFRRRRRGRTWVWSNEQVELHPGRRSRVDPETQEWMIALQIRGIGGRRDGKLLCDVAMPVSTNTLRRAEVGETSLSTPKVVAGQVVCQRQRHYRGVVLQTDEICPRGQEARRLSATLILRGALGAEARRVVTERVASANLYRRLVDAASEPLAPSWELDPFWCQWQVRVVEDWLSERLETLGYASGEDWALLEPEDICPPPLPEQVVWALEHRWPRQLSSGSAHYRLEYDFGRRVVTLQRTDNGRREDFPASLLPRVPGFAIELHERGRKTRLRGRSR